MTPAAWMFDLAKCLLIFGALLGCVHLLVYAERRICAGIQGRVGPNLVGPFGLLQPLADALKMIFKEDILPAKADRFLYIAAPLFVAVPPVVCFAVIPFGAQVEVAGFLVPLQVAAQTVPAGREPVTTGLDLLIALAVLGLSVYGISFGAWASNNKWSLLGGLRSSAQIISYELALGLTALSVVVVTGTVDLRRIVLEQSDGIGSWHLWKMPLAALVFYIAALAENNRLPFDLAEAEAELVGGYHTEYASLKFAMFFMGEYIAVVTMSALFVTLFLGGWSFPGVDPAGTGAANALASVAVFAAKTAAVILLYMVIRWTLPRFTYQKLMQFGWKVLLPMSLIHIVVYSLFRMNP
jgi:NADH-quinone oxidoreductase subunit H